MVPSAKYRLTVNGYKNGLSFQRTSMVRWFREDESHRHEANYQHVVHVDYHDYDYEDYWRFRRGEKQLVS